MAHKLIAGITLSGKSTLARAIVADARKRGIVPVIYDPCLSDEWDSEFITDDEYEFFSTLKKQFEKGARIVAVVDEADTLLSMSHRHNWWLFMRGRHFGIEAIAITQRPKLVAPSVRSNAPELFVFNLCKSDAQELADDYSAPDIAQACGLRQGEFLCARWRDGKKVVDRCRIF